ncbi:MAG: hypothetical protein ABI847_06170, partial [Anaerolineales bacterium]
VDNLTVEQGGVGLVAADSVSLTDSSAVALVAGSATLTNVRVGLLVAGEVNGNVTTIMDTRQVATAGLIAGLVLGLLFFVGGLFRRR